MTLSRIRTAAGEIQLTALFLVVFGTVAMAFGCKFGWAELKTLAASVAGAGIQAITSQIRSMFQSKEASELPAAATAP